MNIDKILTHPKAITSLGVVGLADASFHLILPEISKGHESLFDLAYYAANEAMFFVSFIAVQIAATLSAYDKRLKSLEEKQ